ncbi:MAG: alpha-2-macroglobulin, partial [Delftia sp.]|nr:alpha-2-macroglobulin [Delftia sp.]
QPVRAGFSLALVDEAIFALAADETPDIFDAFYSPRPDIVYTYHSLRPIRWLDWGMGGGGGGGEAPGGNPRSDFPDTAFWAPALATGDDGLAHVRVPLPDSLTDWRAVVRAISADTKAGQATANVTVALPLSIQPILPRFLIQGDHTTLRAVVHNHTGESQVATVRLSPTGLKLDAALSMTQQITLPANGAVAVEWPIVAEKLGQASARMDVSLPGGEWRDAVVLPLPVMPLAIPQVDTVTAEVQDEWAETITLP